MKLLQKVLRVSAHFANSPSEKALPMSGVSGVSFCDPPRG